MSVFEFKGFGELAEAAPEIMQSLAKPGPQPPNRDGMQANLSYPDAVTEPPSWNDTNSTFDLAQFLRGPPAEKNAVRHARYEPK